MSKDAIVVFTAKSVERILAEGGSSAWRLRPRRARQCDYVVCTRNAHAFWGQGTEDHHSAFLVGKVRDVVPCSPTPENNESPEHRYSIEFSEYARVNIPDVWKGDRNPIKYESIEELGIDPSTLSWETVKNPVATAESVEGPAPQFSGRSIGPLTISEAKMGLAMTFNVAPESVEITIRG